ncbi:methyltransferase family protein [Larkinella rosea]|uniref:Isoprenylcysteine carboxylmethyltransferase family protein n=1 Tax=Larkinella rosea TaxID=2025312 RepID=A0A3P1BU35_9BACT|nr:isoprenylcysteine carboxylmethyltransferase family protein [Larkinella rosea]RRB04376.1 isoprenylcysteine carboxylmethyltransferase family protein [Larkinella rosea]
MKPVTSSLLLRNLFFTLLQPGIVTGLIPYLLVRNKVKILFSNPFEFQQYLGVLIWLLGIIILFHCIIRFATEGQGTISPADPTKRLVIKGLYRFSRNPMYVGVMLILIGEAVFCPSVALWLYTISVFIAVSLFVITHEEPRLRNDFGEDYEAYCRRVRRWI